MSIKIRVKKRLYTISTFAVVFLMSLLLATSIALYAYFRYLNTPYFYTLVFLAVLSFVIPVGGYIYYEYVQIQNKEYYFPQFLKDLADGVRAGLSLPQAVINVSKINYGALTEDVRKLATHISWGIPFDEAIRRFAERTGSKMIHSSVDLIIEAYRAGGGVADILDTVAEDAGKMHSLKEERKTKFSGFISTIYSVYVIFLLIVVVLINALLPEIPTIPGFGSAGSPTLGLHGSFTNVSPRSIPEDELIAIFFHLAIIEAIFAGLLAGIAGEGNVIAGIKHAIILVFIGVAVFQIFIPIPDPRDRIARAIAKMPINVEASVSVGRFFVEEGMTSGELARYVEDYLRRTNLPISGVRAGIRFEEDPQGCPPCEDGVVGVRPDALVVNKPTYVGFRVKTDPERGVYVVYVS